MLLYQMICYGNRGYIYPAVLFFTPFFKQHISVNHINCPAEWRYSFNGMLSAPCSEQKGAYHGAYKSKIPEDSP